MTIQHKNLAAGKWNTFSLVEQMGNIGSEISRAVRWQYTDEKLYQHAIERALELLDLTMSDPRWCRRLKELARVRESICDALLGGVEYTSSFVDLERYFFSFAFAARMSK